MGKPRFSWNWPLWQVWQLWPFRPVPRRRATQLLACCGGIGLGCAQAAAQDPTSAGWLRLETSLTVNAEMLNTHWTALVRAPDSAPDYSLATLATSTSWGSHSALPTLVELTPNHLAAADPQVYVRPQFALGTTSDSLRGWLRIAGIDASSCTAPLMKMHSAFAGAGAHAKVSVSARCSIH